MRMRFRLSGGSGMGSSLGNLILLVLFIMILFKPAVSDFVGAVIAFSIFIVALSNILFRGALWIGRSRSWALWQIMNWLFIYTAFGYFLNYFNIH